MVLAGMLLISVSLAPAPVEAQWPCYEAAPRTCSFIRTYYSDARLTNEVGSWFWRCNNRSTRDGQTTSYYTTEIVNLCPVDGGGDPV